MTERDFSGTVLVVSDDPHVRDEAANGFGIDATVELAMDAREAWKILESSDPALVVIDIQTGSSGGFGLRRDMSQVPRLADVPTIMLLERKQDEWLAKQAGASVTKVKPLDVDDFVEMVTDLAKADVKSA
jgi:DNA-binding response OmpR family regulator